MINDVRQFHVDETGTGTQHLRLRGDRKIVVAAKTCAGDDFEWVHRLSAACPPPPRGEVKAPELLALAATSDQARRTIRSATEHYSIFVVDLFHRYDGAVRLLAEAAGMDQHDDRAVHNVLNAELRELAQRMLMHIKESLIDSSVIGRVERMAQSLSPGGLVDGSLLDRDALNRMSTQEFLEAVTRMQILVSEVLNPDIHERALADMWWKQRLFCGEGELDTRVLSVILSDSHVYDNGRKGAFAQITEAQARLVDAVERSVWSAERVTAGAVEMDDSARVAGIRAADVAARIAADLIEKDYRGTVDAVRRLRQRFKQVFLNGSLHDD